MTYDLTCLRCHTTIEINCLVAERDNQRCLRCDDVLVNVTAPTKQILIPGRFYTTKEEHGQPA